MDAAIAGLWVLQAAVFVVMLIGLAGVIIPVLPGLVIIWAATLAYAVIAGVHHWAVWVILVIETVLMAVGSLIDNVTMGAAARQTGASWWSIGAALAGAIVGSILLPPVGGLILALLALFAAEWFRHRDWRKALDTSRSMALGCGWGVIARTLMAVVMIVLWVVWAFLLS